MYCKNPKLIYYYAFGFCSLPRLFVYLRMRMSTSKQHSCVQGPLRECRSIRSGASGLPYYFAPLVCISEVIEWLAVWRHNKPKKPKKNNYRASAIKFTNMRRREQIFQESTTQGKFAIMVEQSWTPRTEKSALEPSGLGWFLFLGWLQKIFLLFSPFGSASIPPVHSSPRFTPPLSSWRTQKTCRIPVTPKFYNLSFASWAPRFFLSFFLGFRRPNLITGLSGWRALY